MDDEVSDIIDELPPDSNDPAEWEAPTPLPVHYPASEMVKCDRCFALVLTDDFDQHVEYHRNVALLAHLAGSTALAIAQSLVAGA